MADKKQELLSKFNRVAKDPSQLQAFVNELIKGSIIKTGELNVADLPVVESLESITKEEFEAINGKAFFSDSGYIYYPTCKYDENDYLYITFGTDDFVISYINIYLNEDEGEPVTDIFGDIQLKSIEANPTLEGTESALEGLQVGGAKYKNTILYKHYLSIFDVNEDLFLITLLSPRATPIKSNDDINMADVIVTEIYYDSDDTGFACMSGSFYIESQVIHFIGCPLANVSALGAKSIEISSITDTVTQL